MREQLDVVASKHARKGDQAMAEEEVRQLPAAAAAAAAAVLQCASLSGGQFQGQLDNIYRLDSS
jgi:hypothetical protein